MHTWRLGVALAILLSLSWPLLARAHRCAPSERPLLIHGATVMVAGTNVDDPPPNVVGLVGEIGTLPYQVPAGHHLVLTSVGMSGNRQPQAGLILWVGDHPAENHKTIPATDVGWGSAHAPALQTILPAGMVLHVRLSNATPVEETYGWYVFGCLLALE